MENFINLPDQSNVNPMAATSTIILCSGVPWDADYNHVRMFGSKSERDSYIMSKSVKTIHSSTPVMFGSFTYDVNGNQEQVMRCNYMGFQNSPFTNEWKYAFITNITWLSVNSCEISYSLDVWQNNIYDCAINPCFVEREHCYKSEDSVDFSLIPETLETGEIICSGQVDLNIGYGTPLYIILLSDDYIDLDGQTPRINVYNNNLCGLGVTTATSKSQVQTIIDNYNKAGKGDAIVAIYQTTGYSHTATAGEDYNYIQEGTLSVGLGSTVDGYAVKNQKTLQYPYHYCILYGYNQSMVIEKFELSTHPDHQLDSKYRGTTLPIPAYIAYPANYAGLADNYNFAIQLDHLVQCAWTNDAFQAYLVQQTPIQNTAIENLYRTNNVKVAESQNQVFGQTLSGIVNAFTLNIAGVSNNLYNMYTTAQNVPMEIETSEKNLIEAINAQVESHSMIPPHAMGGTNGNILTNALNLNKISMFRMNVKAEMAKTIDDFFTMFGYPVHRIKTPNLNSRSSWNYVKTVECGITGNCILQDLQTLRKIFDKGVTIWHTNDVGNYNLANN